MHCYVLLNSWSSIQINLKHVFPCDDIWQLAISDKKKKTTNNCNLVSKHVYCYIQSIKTVQLIIVL